jgi:Mor family transcriptional regulator
VSDFIRNLALACAPRLAEHVETAVKEVVRSELPAIIEAVLRERYPGETVHHYASRRPGGMRRVRDAAIRAKYDGKNVKALAAEFGLSARMIFNIVSGQK